MMAFRGWIIRPPFQDPFFLVTVNAAAYLLLLEGEVIRRGLHSAGKLWHV